MSDSPAEVALPDGRVVPAPPGASPRAIAEEHGLPRVRDAIAARVNGEPVDLERPLSPGGPVHLSLVYPEDPDALEILRHSTSHLMAQAVKELWPDVQIAQGPAIEDGFYYDFRRDEPFSEQELGKIEKRMRKIVQRDLPIRRHEIPKQEAARLFREENEPYKLYFVESKSGPVASY